MSVIPGIIFSSSVLCFFFSHLLSFFSAASSIERGHPKMTTCQTASSWPQKNPQTRESRSDDIYEYRGHGMMNHHEESLGAVAEGFSIFVKVYRSKPVNKLQLSHWTTICKLGPQYHSKTFLKLYLKWWKSKNSGLCTLIELQYPQDPNSHVPEQDYKLINTIPKIKINLHWSKVMISDSILFKIISWTSCHLNHQPSTRSGSIHTTLHIGHIHTSS